MTKRELIDRLSMKTGLTRKEVRDFLDVVLQELAEAFIRQERVELRGFGVFIPVKRKAPKRDERIPRVKFKLSRSIRERMIEEDKRRA